MNGIGLIFDFDGTICLSEPVHMDAWAVVARRLGIPVSEAFFEDGVGVADSQIAKELIASGECDISWEEILDLKHQEFRQRDPSQFVLVPGAVDALRFFHGEGCPIALATSSMRPDIEPIFKLWNLGAYFQEIFTRESVSKPKPDPEMYLKAAAALGRKPSECFVFEDSIPGVTAARAAGANVIGMGTTHTVDELAPLRGFIRDFSDLPQLSKIIDLR